MLFREPRWPMSRGGLFPWPFPPIFGQFGWTYRAANHFQLSGKRRP